MSLNWTVMSHLENKKPRRSRVFSILFIVMMFVAGPALIGIGSVVTAAEGELARTGTHVEGIVSDVQDSNKASRQRFKVDYLDNDETGHFVWVSWSTKERPIVGQRVSVIYSGSNPGSAVVEGYDGEGISLTGLGVVLTVVFGVLGVILVTSRRRGKSKRGRASSGTSGEYS